MEIKTLKGTGEFSKDSMSFESSFEIVFYPYRTIIYPTNFPFAGFTENFWKLTGKLEDNRTIISDKLLQGGVGNDSLYAFELKINHKKTTNEFAEFPLIGFYDSDITFLFENCEIELRGKKEFKEERSNYKNWRVASEGSILRIRSKKYSKNEFLDMAIVICKLLSIATANDVVFHEQIFEGEEIIHKNMRGNFYGFTNIIPQNQVEVFLRGTIESWTQLSRDERNVISDITNYINSACDEYDYLDDRIFRLAQCWEISANKLINNDDNDLPDDLNDLRSKLKITCREWRKEYKKIIKLIQTQMVSGLEECSIHCSG